MIYDGHLNTDYLIDQLPFANPWRYFRNSSTITTGTLSTPLARFVTGDKNFLKVPSVVQTSVDGVIALLPVRDIQYNYTHTTTTEALMDAPIGVDCGYTLTDDALNKKWGLNSGVNFPTGVLVHDRRVSVGGEIIYVGDGFTDEWQFVKRVTDGYNINNKFNFCIGCSPISLGRDIKFYDTPVLTGIVGVKMRCGELVGLELEPGGAGTWVSELISQPANDFSLVPHMSFVTLSSNRGIGLATGGPNNLPFTHPAWTTASFGASRAIPTPAFPSHDLTINSESGLPNMILDGNTFYNAADSFDNTILYCIDPIDQNADWDDYDEIFNTPNWLTLSQLVTESATKFIKVYATFNEWRYSNEPFSIDLTSDINTANVDRTIFQFRDVKLIGSLGSPISTLVPSDSLMAGERFDTGVDKRLYV